ncbi:alpha-ketoglutarate-dependent dioxygenase AlkB [Christiangramia fulva]|uniref:Alpha-ketoglutarate-dependent dioxygenase AlkB n=1 Tax=Christiangramia fulva TaxID=2126553 RepID=A0A2R3Z3D0_9FLAO|nr:alpha-ketoglutarate-dependent dioxygenase AlkB [Christiangramia fulva]AVR44776.1 alpha-ketoglutarate-dependent dioxygenase AlkB [Christiangramia fulva]
MDQLDLFGAPEEETKTHFEIQNGEYIHIPGFFNKAKADKFFQSLLQNIEWKQESMNMYGKEIKFPRLTAWYGENDKPYSFSGITLNPNPWNKELLEIKEKIETEAEVTFNSVLLNRYRDGNDSISWHTDAEKELGKNPVIASVNFGAERKFQLKHIETGEKVELLLKHGSLLVMKGELQHYWKHQVPKTKAKVAERINLTFRVIK